MPPRRARHVLTLALLAVPVTARPQLGAVRDTTARPVTIGGVTVRATPPAGSVRTAPDINGAWVFAGVKSDVLQLRGMDANLTEKTGRQLFAKIPGVFVYDMDGSGNQVNISTRGLDAHRSWELNARQDGIVINSDLYGYPASHYNPPLESIERVELVRGTAALQYGSQFGGMVNYITKSADTTRRAAIESNNTLGGFGMRSTYNAVGGRVGKLDYYAYLHLRRADGYRAAAQSDGEAQFVKATLRATPTLTVRAQVGRSTYRYRIPGPLTDAMFATDPRMATRTRNYYSPDITVPALQAEWTPTPHTRMLAQVSGVVGVRNSVQFIGFATVRDTVDPRTGAFPARQVDIDTFGSLTGEVRLVHDWTIAGRSHPLAVGVAVSDNDMRRQQLGRGTTGTGWDLALSSDDFVRDVRYATRNVALFAEQVVRVSDRWLVVPGVRVEQGRTRMRGRLDYYDPADIPRTLRHDFPLFGVRTSYRLRNASEVYGGLTQAYRPQILKDVLPESAIERTDPNLRDARGYTIEAGIRGTWRDRVSYDVGGFVLRYDDRYGAVVQTDPATNTAFIYKTNVGSSVTRGIETRLDGTVYTGPHATVQLFTATSFFDATYRAGTVTSAGVNAPLAGKRVESVPRWISRSGITATGPRWSVTAQVSHTSETFSDPLNTVTPTANGARGLVPGYTLLDLNGSIQVSPWLRVGGGISNLANAQYFTRRPTMYPGPGVWPSDGRAMRVTVEVTP